MAHEINREDVLQSKLLALMMLRSAALAAWSCDADFQFYVAANVYKEIAATERYEEEAKSTHIS